MKKKDTSKHSRTDWQALESMSDEDIDYSDIPPLDDDFFDRAVLRLPKEQVTRTAQFDYTQWRQDLLAELSGEDISRQAKATYRRACRTRG
jgi:hypothetical protein